MARHPGDPKSDALGEQPYDESEYPHHTYDPPPMPPEPGNEHNFVPYRGQVQHGVQIDRRPEDVGLPYAGEQAAYDDYNDPHVNTVRDLEPVKPIRVEVVEGLDLTRRIKGRSNSVLVSATGAFVRVASQDFNRTRLIVKVISSDFQACPFYWSHQGDGTLVTAVRDAYASGPAATILDTEFTGGLFVRVADGATNQLYVSTWSEFRMPDGESLT